jgi:hypothetical protein
MIKNIKNGYKLKDSFFEIELKKEFFSKLIID